MLFRKIIDECVNEILNEIYNTHDRRLVDKLRANNYTDKSSFLKYSKDRRKRTGKTDPSTEFQFIRYVDEEWCVHFTDRNSVINISKNGFKRGTPNVMNVPYGFGGKSKRSGYNYAFLANDICSGKEDTDVTRFWGYNCVIFRCSGVLGYHRGDKNRQVVFWGPDAHDLVGIVGGRDNNGANVCQIIGKGGNIIYQFDLAEFPKVVKWLENNEVQYRKQLYTENK